MNIEVFDGIFPKCVHETMSSKKNILISWKKFAYLQLIFTFALLKKGAPLSFALQNFIFQLIKWIAAAA